MAQAKRPALSPFDWRNTESASPDEHWKKVNRQQSQLNRKGASKVLAANGDLAKSSAPGRVGIKPR